MSTQIRIAGIIEESIVDGPGIRFVVFAQGCGHKCPGCHNPHTHSFDGGSLIEVEEAIKQMRNNPLLDGITLSGGEPFEQAAAMGELAFRARLLGYNVMTYTGYTYEYILENQDIISGWRKLLENTDTLVDGRFELDKKNLLLRFKGSENQRIINVRKSLLEGRMVLAE
ncbi:MAG: anaerobic ribonucleoside-triphosphate reductase activating protein [Clostridia bacterium]|nr:anaerobic ribonucleoside-triphosphate reductase activating protein [Clostridia bacterium]